MKGKHQKKQKGFWEGLLEKLPWKKDEDDQGMVRLSGGKEPMSKKKKLIIIFSSIGAVVLALIITVVSIVTGYLNQVNRVSDLSGDLGINSALPTDDVQNIALFGLDTRNNDESGRSDAMIILSIDRKHNKIKMTSIARDSLVDFGDGKKSKLTHAFGWGGHSLAVKVINKNFGMDITDFAYVNFYEFAGIIDYIGGVEVDVSASEMNVMNRKYTKYIREMGIDCPDVTQTGMQRLNGGQALAYSRNRYTGSDLERGNRQKEVLEAAYAQVKDTPMTKFPALISKILSMCHTNMTNSEMLSIATWAVTKQPSIEQFGLPSKELNAEIGNRGDGYGSVVRYDMQQASQVLYNFIYEPEPEPQTDPTGETATPAQ